MKNSLLLLFIFCALFSFGQKKSDQLQAEQSKLEKRLSSTKSLLEKAKKNTATSLTELKLIENQVRDREQLVQNMDNQIRGAELTISAKGNQIILLKKRLVKLKIAYKKLILYAYKHRSKHGKMMFIFSSENYFEAVKRTNYLKRIGEIQQKQFKVILQNQRAISEEINSISTEKQRKEELMLQKIEEKTRIEKSKADKQVALEKFKKDETKLLADLKTQERQREDLKRKIKKAIEKEIAESEAKAKKEAQKTASTSKTTSTKTTSGTKATSGTTATTTTAKKEVVITETKESLALGQSFESNKGKLPWPVAKGSITEGYGKNAHPTLENVYTNNNGIDIGAPKSSQVRSVFEGEVSSVLSIPGAGKVVIIKHGSYRTVYSNLSEVYVSVGSKISTKQAIGSLLVSEGESLSTAHFEIHQVVDGSVVRLNPTVWINQ
ncbi:MAG: murein hydrolase activator EnvC family protein [Fluviicola sp.]|jgi:septal ring factor EnvC (AmiA/AmiB activator)